ncbi:MAG: HAMP domain-containing sensor histidine kinase [Vicinamibacterales bacterium]
MRRRRLPLGVLVPAALVVLVGALAALQYHWLGQVSEAERDQLRTSLDQRARGFADDFDREIGQIFVALQATRAELAAVPADDFAARLDDWRKATRFPDVIAGIYEATQTTDDVSLRAWRPAERRFETADWPTSLARVRERLRPPTDAGREVVERETERVATAPATGAAGRDAGADIGLMRPKVFTIGVPPVMSDIPALAIPITESAPATMVRGTMTAAGGTGKTNATSAPPPPPPPPDVRAINGMNGVFFSLRGDRTYLIVALDADYLRQTMLPAIADLHFPEEGGDRYRVEVVDEARRPVLSRQLPAGATLDTARADVTAAFFGGVRLETLRQSASNRVMAWTVTTRDQSEIPAGVVTRLRPSESRLSVVLEEHGGPEAAAAAAIGFSAAPGWQLLIQHADGSLDAAVANARRRNLWLSFSILSVLALSVGLIVLNARRSERLAGQQMDFVATVSHELRTPLAVIRSAAQNLSAGVVGDATQARKYGDLIDGEGRRLTDMVEQVLEYAGLSGNRRPVRSHPVDLRDVARDVVESCRPLLDAGGLEVETSFAPDTPLVLVDDEAMRRALANLVANAVKYGADGRWIGLVVRPVTVRGRTEVQVTVSDRGRGIAAEDLPHIFEPFYRGRDAHDRQIHGNGLGLSLVRRILEAHGGRVQARSAPGEGTTFTLHVPALRGEVAASPLAPQTSAPPAGGHAS